MKVRNPHRPHAARLALLVLLGLSLSGCNTLSRLSQVGEEPRLTSIQNPAEVHGYRPVQMPLPAPRT